MRMSRSAAYKHGKALLKRMKGRGWKLRVHENMGWHYTVVNNGMSISEGYGCADGRFGALLSDDGLGGLAVWTEKGKRFNDPNAAVKRQLLFAKAYIATLQDIVDKVENNLKWKKGWRKS